MDIDEEDLEPTPLALPHQLAQRAASLSPARYCTDKRNTGNVLLMDAIISDSDGAGDGEEDDDEDDDFHSVTSQDEFHITPDKMDVIFGRGQPLRDHPVRQHNAFRCALELCVLCAHWLMHLFFRGICA